MMHYRAQEVVKAFAITETKSKLHNRELVIGTKKTQSSSHRRQKDKMALFLLTSPIYTT